MRKNYFFLALVVLLFGSMTTVSAQVSNDNEDGVNKVDSRFAKDFVPGQVLVKFKDASPVNVRRAAGKFHSVDKKSVNDVLKEFGTAKMEKVLPNEKPGRQLRRARAYNGQFVQERDLSQLYLVETDEEHAPQTMQLVEKLKDLNEVEYAEPNYKMYLMDAEIAGSFGGNPYITQQWYLDSYGVKQLWNKPIINPKRPVIAIIDTGVDLTHPDIAPNLWTNKAEAEGEAGYDNDGNGFRGDVHGWDFINNTPNVKDFNMHGTHVAGIAAAANNGIGIIGANPQALIMPISVMQSDGTGDIATIIKGIDYAAKNGADVLNLSLGGYVNSRAMRQALEKAYQTAVIVAAAGNDGICVNSSHHPSPCYGAAPMFPAAYSFVLGVQATQSNGSLAGFSNYDDDGNTFSSVTTLQDPDGFNYELKAPGTNMLSTIPGGKYKVLQGTSMASPLVASAISALKMVKNYDTQEILWGDLLHTDNIAQAYAVKARPAELDLMKIMYRERKELADETEEDYSGDGEIDAGETVSLYPVIRTTFGPASNIKMYLEMGDEFEDPNTVQIITDKNNKVDFGLHLDAYGKGVSLNPLIVKIADDVADNRHIKMRFVATCDESNVTYIGTFTMVVTNMVKISGLISEDRTLTADHVYLVNENLGVMEGATLTIEPGTRLEFAVGMGLSSFGKLVATGTPEKPIVFTGHNGSTWAGINCMNNRDIIRYCRIEGQLNGDGGNGKIDYPYMQDCVIVPSTISWNNWLFSNIEGERNTIMNITGGVLGFENISNNLQFSNIINNMDLSAQYNIHASYSQLNSNNFMNNFAILNSYEYTGKYAGKSVLLGKLERTPTIDHADFPSYLGTGREDIIRPFIFEIGNAPNTYCQVDLSNMPTRPYAEAHGIVWEVCVNGKDAQDE